MSPKSLLPLLFLAAAAYLARWHGPSALPGLPSHRIHAIDKESADRLVEEPVPLQGNEDLRQATSLFRGVIQGSETVAVEEDGSLLMLDKFNYVWRATADAAAPGGYRLADRPSNYLGTGRPLGFKKDAQGNLIVCNSNQGLIKLQGNEVVLLTARVSDDSPIEPGSHITYANDLDISEDGTVFFTDSHDIPVMQNWGTARPWFDTFTSYLYGLYSGSKTGRLLAYYPNNQTTHVLAKGLWYANGVAVSADGSFVAVAETNQFRVLRCWLRGARAGSVDTLISRVPGFPDGVSRASDGGFWVAMPGRRTGLLKALRIESIRSVLPWLPSWLRPKISPWGAAMKVSSDGQVARFLEDPSGQKVAFVSAIEEERLHKPDQHGNTFHRLFLGNIVQDYVSYLDIAD